MVLECAEKVDWAAKFRRRCPDGPDGAPYEVVGYLTPPDRLLPVPAPAVIHLPVEEGVNYKQPRAFMEALEKAGALISGMPLQPGDR
jgi:hypothetical protein